MVIFSLGGCLKGFVSMYCDVFSRLRSVIGLGFVLLVDSFNSMRFISCMISANLAVLIEVVC